MLNVRAVQSAEIKEKQYKLHDQHGLFLVVNPTGSKLWRLKYRLNGKEKSMSFGPFPLISLAEARRRRDEARKLLIDRVDPMSVRKEQGQPENQRYPFCDVFAEFLKVRMADKSEGYQDTVQRRIEKHILPHIGKIGVGDIKPGQILEPLRLLETRGKVETAHRCLQVVGQTFRFAVASGYTEIDPSASLKGALRSRQAEHMAAPTNDPEAVGGILRMIDDYAGSETVRAALRLLPLVFSRPGDLRQMRWADIDDISGAEPAWHYIVEKTKTDHIVALSRQSVEILREIQPLTQKSEYVFPSARSLTRPLSNMALGAALRRIGISNKELVPHGWRAVARTMLHERLKFAPEIIEHQLAHRVPDALGAAYNRTRFLDDRRVMMQAWSDFLDRLRINHTKER